MTTRAIFNHQGILNAKLWGTGDGNAEKTEAKHKLENESILLVSFAHCESKVVLQTRFHFVGLYPKMNIWRYRRKGLNSATNLLVGKD